jgi:hypothetical protein
LATRDRRVSVVFVVAIRGCCSVVVSLYPVIYDWKMRTLLSGLIRFRNISYY